LRAGRLIVAISTESFDSSFNAIDERPVT